MRIKREVTYRAFHPDDVPKYAVEVKPGGFVSITLCPNTTQQRTVDLPIEAIEFVMHVWLKLQDLKEENCYIKL